MLHLLVAVLEPSADPTAVGVVRALRAGMPSLEVSRFGGTALAEEGTRDIALPGSLAAGLRRTPVDVALLVGGGAFTQARLAGRVRRHGVRVAAMAGAGSVHWRWAASRLASACDVVIASPVDDVADLVAVGASVVRVGHPMADEVTLPLAADRSEARRALGLTEDHPVVAVCVGAGQAALRVLAPVVRDALRLAQARGERLQVAVATSDPVQAALAGRLFGISPGSPPHLGPPRTVVTAADVAVCADGESTLLAALLGTPLLLARRRGWRERGERALAQRLGGRLAPFEAWPNRVAGDAIVPELVDDACRAPRVASEISALIAHAADQARGLAEVRKAVRAERSWPSIARLLIDMAVEKGGAAQPPTVKRSS